MALSIAEQNNNQMEILTISAAPVLQTKHDLFRLRAIILQVCAKKNIVLNSEQESIPQLVNIINNAKNAKNDLDAFEKEVEAWANVYKQKLEEATQKNRALFAGQARGIYRGLNNKQFELQAWCEDLDFVKALKTFDPEEITKAGTYIVKPKDLSNPEFLSDALGMVLNKNPQANIKLLIPVTHDGHWRLAKVEIQQGKIAAASLWDSLNNSDLSTHNAFINMQQALHQAQPGEFILVTPDARGIQKNGWSCGDYVMQECCRELNIQNSLSQVNGSQALRLSLVQLIKRNNPELQEAYISPGDQSLFAYIEKNRDKFDEEMARRLSKLYEDNPDEVDEGKLVKQARDETYKAFNLSNEPSEDVGSLKPKT